MTLIDRGGVRDWLQTGMASLTIFANCSLGQRQLILGNDKVGKSTMLSNIAKNSSINSYYNLALSFNKFFFYNFIGSSKREFVYNKLLHSSLNKKFNFFVDSTISLNLYSQIRTPYYSVLNCLSLAHNGLNSVHILDSLSNHAKLYRTFMLDLKRSPGREAYPGDVFYLHSNLLEKYGQLNFFHNEGSVTGLPVSVIQNDDITDYITTNLISITDGQ
jgi:F-type H+-transporting ATPase subunit alpha